MKKNKLEKKIKTKGMPDDVDRYVGNRVRMRRSLLGMSQEKLADFVGVTFQQIQKYERGANRISSSRLLSFSNLLEVPVTYFFDGVEDSGIRLPSVRGFGESRQEKFINSPKKIKDTDLMDQKETRDLVKAYYAVQDPKRRKEIVKFIKTMSKS